MVSSLRVILVAALLCVIFSTSDGKRKLLHFNIGILQYNQFTF